MTVIIRLNVDTFKEDIKEGRRFEFGRNWKSFLSTVNNERIKEAERSLKEMLECASLEGTHFLDVGSGNGLFSLAACRLGAIVHSFDYDPESVTCTQKLRSKYFPDNNNWSIEQGSVLDKKFLSSLGVFDIVYSWGVLHHTGNMWEALGNIVPLVKENGILFIAIYNDQGKKSKFWLKVKKLYCSGIIGKSFVCIVFIPYLFLRTLAGIIIKRKNVFSEYKKDRGMSIVHDWFDWLGGFPYEVAKVEEIFHYYKTRGFILKNIKTTNSSGNNQLVFIKKETM
ncbi:MAG: class I SAM-dependent methyltransferase [Thermodesulfobacteriota bacterium]|nr:class I SAM-dependent methyltransferase [Thermodesulfobacteriota bacterium]